MTKFKDDTSVYDITPINPDREKMALIAYHAPCKSTDGFTSAWVTYNALLKKGMNADLLPMEYTKESEAELLYQLKEQEMNYDYTHLYIVDFSLPVSYLEMLESVFLDLKVVVLDHHKTAFEKYGPDDMIVAPYSQLRTEIHGTEIILANNKCGASLCWSHFYPNVRYPRLIQFVEDYDLWKFKLGDETKWINKYLVGRAQTIEVWDSIDADLSSEVGYKHILHLGYAAQQSHDWDVKEIASHAVPIKIDGYQGLVVLCPQEFVDDVGVILAKQSGTFGALYQVDVANNKIKIGLRSNGDFDVSSMAKAYGGGGHKNAAGFYSTIFPDVEVMEIGEEDAKIGIPVNVKEPSDE